MAKAGPCQPIPQLSQNLKWPRPAQGHSAFPWAKGEKSQSARVVEDLWRQRSNPSSASNQFPYVKNGEDCSTYFLGLWGLSELIKIGTGPGSWITLFVYIIFHDTNCVIKEYLSLLALRRQGPHLFFPAIISPRLRIDVAFSRCSVKYLSLKRNEWMVPRSGTKLLCDLKQIVSPLLTSVPASVEGEVGPDGPSLRLFYH